MKIDFLRKSRCRYFFIVSYEIVMRLIFSLPRYRFCNNLKATFLRMMGAKVGHRVVFYPGVWISFAPGNLLEIGSHVDLALDVLITTGGGVSIGDRTLVGYRTQILSTNHVIPQVPERIFNSGSEHQPVKISKDVWIGANCIILPGVTIEEGAVVAAGSIVTKSVPPWTIVAGVPAKILRQRQGCDGFELNKIKRKQA